MPIDVCGTGPCGGRQRPAPSLGGEWHRIRAAAATEPFARLRGGAPLSLAEDGERLGYETSAEAMAGLAHRFGGDGPPRRAGGGAIDDYAAGMLAFIGVVVAVRAARQGGGGRRIDTSLAGAATMFQPFDATPACPVRIGGLNAVGPSVRSRLWPSGDGAVYAVLPVDRGVERFALALGIALGTPDKGDIVEVAKIEAATGRLPAGEVIAIVRSIGGHATVAHDDVSLKAKLVASGRFREEPQPDWGLVSHVGYPAEFAPPLVDSWLPAPAWGAHTAQVLREAGLACQEIEALQDAGVIECHGHPYPPADV